MAEVEVIDLLSSSPLVRVGEDGGRNPRTTTATTAAATMTLETFSARNGSGSRTGNGNGNGTGYLFSDPFASSPILDRSPMLPAPKATMGPSSTKHGKGVRNLDSEGFVDISSDVLEVSCSFPELPRIVERIPIEKPTARSIADADVGSDACPTAVGLQKGTGDFMFLDDDFDSTADLDTSYTLPGQPVTKKRRASSDIEEIAVGRIGKTGSTGADSGSLGVPNDGEKTGLRKATSDAAGRPKASCVDTAGREPRAGTLRKSKTSIYEDDPIIFTSSPDFLKAAREKRQKVRRERERELELEDSIPGNFGRHHEEKLANSRNVNGGSSDDDLPDISGIAEYVSQNHLPRPVIEKERVKITAATSFKPIKPAEQKALDKARAAADRVASKEAEKERKRLLREDKARDKQHAAELAKVNTRRTDKKVSTSEMIVDLPADLDEKLAKQIKSFLSPLQVDVDNWANTMPNVVKWRRKAEARYDEEMDYWVPTVKHIKKEKHILCHMLAREFVDLSTAPEGRDLDSHVLQMKAKFEDCDMIYLIEGLTPWLRKNKTIRNRQFTEAVRTQMVVDVENEAPTSTQTKRKSKEKQKPEYVDEDAIEDSLLKLQVVHGVLIHHTSGMVESAQWVVAFTQHISTVPYRYVCLSSMSKQFICNAPQKIPETRILQSG
jgi:crossover junction endonuclease EME1